MSEIDGVFLNSIDNISVEVIDEIDNISISVLDPIDNINIDYSSQIESIELNIGSGFATGSQVSSVNTLIDDVVLTASAELSLTTASNGYYNHIFVHNLNYQNVIVNVFTPTNELVFADILNEDSNYVNIRAAIDLTGYKAVAQR
jgi:hypothetical protein